MSERKKIGLMCDKKKKEARELMVEVRKWLKARGCQTFSVTKKNIETPNVIIAFGGDGFILHSADKISKQGFLIPFVRINFGRRGFLANVEPHEVFERLNQLLHNDYIVTKRARIEVTVASPGQAEIKADALNDIVIERTGTRSLLYKVIINGKEKIETIADGLIFCTRTGSTAYNRALGGPTLLKEDKFVLTKVGRTNPEEPFYFVRPATSVFQLTGLKGKPRVAVDGDELLKLKEDNSVTIRISPQKTLFIEFGDL